MSQIKKKGLLLLLIIITASTLTLNLSAANQQYKWYAGAKHNVVTTWHESSFYDTVRHYANAEVTSSYGTYWAGRQYGAARVRVTAVTPWVWTVNWYNGKGYYGW